MDPESQKAAVDNIMTMPAEARGKAMFVLWLNAVLTLLLRGAWVVTGWRMFRRARRVNARPTLLGEVGDGILRQRSLTVLTLLTVLHLLARKSLVNNLVTRARQD